MFAWKLIECWKKGWWYSIHSVLVWKKGFQAWIGSSIFFLGSPHTERRVLQVRTLKTRYFGLFLLRNKMRFWLEIAGRNLGQWVIFTPQSNFFYNWKIIAKRSTIRRSESRIASQIGYGKRFFGVLLFIRFIESTALPIIYIYSMWGLVEGLSKHL